jgi:hypothetical protein
MEVCRDRGQAKFTVEEDTEDGIIESVVCVAMREALEWEAGKRTKE